MLVALSADLLPVPVEIWLSLFPPPNAGGTISNLQQGWVLLQLLLYQVRPFTKSTWFKTKNYLRS